MNSTFSAEAVVDFINFQKNVQPVLRDSKNPFFKSKYAALDGVIATVYPTLHDNNLMITQLPDITSEGMVLVTRLYHKDGSYLESLYKLPVIDDPQKLGSAITYARRYALMAICGVAPEDDDGNAAAQAVNMPRSKSTTDDLATDEQLTYVGNLLQQKFGISDIGAQNDYLEKNYKVGFEGMTKKVASGLLDKLKDIPATKAAKTPKSEPKF